MKRRKFIQGSLAAGGLLLLPGWTKLAFAQGSMGPPDLVAVMGGEPIAMFDRAIQAMGGMQAFVKKGQKVVVKPNIGWDAAPERAANTNPELVGRIVKHCIDAGAREVYVFDHTSDKWDKCYQNSGIEKAAKDMGAKVIPGHMESYYQTVQIPSVKLLKTTKVHEIILQSDVFINVPVLKHHSSTDLSMGAKNLMGIVWDRAWWHRNGLNRAIADFLAWRKPDLTIIDAYRIMKKNGPRGVSVADTALTKMLVISKDVVAADAAAARIFGKEPSDIEHLKLAHEDGFGTILLDALNIQRLRM